LAEFDRFFDRRLLRIKAMDDSELLSRYSRDQSQEAFTELVRRHLPLVYSVALRRLGGDRHRAEDVAQQVFTALARAASHLVGRSSLEGWLHTATRNIAIQTIRAERRRVARELAAMTSETGDMEPEVDVERLRGVIDPALDR
jgi:RNA polymerase sigma factor (sigma-70 family)